MAPDNSQKLNIAKEEYVQMRAHLQLLYAAAVPDQAAIAMQIQQLEQAQLKVKLEQTGIKGNNPNG